MIGLLCGTREEFAALHTRLQITSLPVTVGGLRFWTGSHPRHDFVLAEPVFGEANALMAATILLSHFGCSDLVVSVQQTISNAATVEMPPYVAYTLQHLRDYRNLRGVRFGPCDRPSWAVHDVAGRFGRWAYIVRARKAGAIADVVGDLLLLMPGGVHA